MSAGKKIISCKINSQKGIRIIVDVKQAVINDVMFTDSNGLKIEKASWYQKINIWIDHKELIGEKLEIRLRDSDAFNDDDVAPLLTIPAYDGKLIPITLDKNIKGKAGKHGELYVKVTAPKIIAINEGEKLGKVDVQDIKEIYSAQIGSEDGKEKHFLVDYDEISWFYAHTRGIKTDENLYLEIRDSVFGKDPLLLIGKNIKVDESGVIKVKINWALIKNKASFLTVYAIVKENNADGKVLYDADGSFSMATAKLMKSSSLVKEAGYKSAVMVESTKIKIVDDNKPKAIIFPLLVKPENDENNKWGKNRNWTAKQGNNMTTFNASRDGGKRKHAARDLYTNALETVVAIADGKVLSVKEFYCETSQVSIRHTLKDGRDFIIRYGELDPKSIKLKVGDLVAQKQEIGKTGKLLKYIRKTNQHVPLMKIDDTIVFMLHFEHFGGLLGFDLSSNPLSDNSKPFNRRRDLIDSLAILQEGYNNTFGTNSPIINNQNPHEFTEHDARLALMKIYDLYGKEMAQTIESIYRWEGKHFKSDQFKICGSPGMEATMNGTAPNYGWDGSLYKKHTEYTPVGIWESMENAGMSGKGGNKQDTVNKKRYIKFPSVEAGMMYIVDFIERHNGNVGRWHSTDSAVQKNYEKDIKQAIPRIVNSF